MLLAAALLVVTGCKKDDKDLNASGEKMTFTASIDNGNDKTSITINGNEGFLNWTEGDVVNINGKEFTATSVDNDGKATFEGEAVTPDTDGKYKAIFPANLYQGGNYVLPATQTYAPDNNLSGVNPMYAESTTTDLKFQSICALLKFTLKYNVEWPVDYPITKIEVSADQALSGPFTIVDNVAKLTSPNAQAGVTLDCGVEGVPLDVDTDVAVFYIAIPAGEYTHLTFKVINKRGDVDYYTSEGTVTVSANKFYTSEHKPHFVDLDYLCFTAEKAGSTVSMKKYGSPSLPALETSTNGVNQWTDFTPGTTTITLANVGDKVYFRKNGKEAATTFSNDNTNYASFVMTGKIAASGNIMSLIDRSCETTAIPCNYCFEGLFWNCTSLTAAPKLPATTLKEYCYEEMFYLCTSLISAPELPATTLKEHCYQNMFASCRALTSAPELLATTLTTDCYFGMFSDCISLTTAPALPATILGMHCYSNMFYNCESLTTAPELPATTLTDFCYSGMFQSCESLTTAPELSATTLMESCYQNMFSNCESLITAPALPATTLEKFCYFAMFQGCKSLTTAPELPATTLKNGCYGFMFYDCIKLTSAPKLPATALTERCYEKMFNRCSSLKSVTMLATTGFDAEDCLKEWLVDAAGEGTGTLWSSYNSENAPQIMKDNLPANWTIKKYEGSK